MLSTLHPRTGQADIHGWLGMSAEALQGYVQFAQHDVWVAGYTERRLFGQTAIGSEIVDDRTLAGSLIHNEYLLPKRVGIYHLVGTVLPMLNGCQGVLGIHRPRDAKDFSHEDAKRLTRLLPHVRRALEAQYRLQRAGQANRSIYSVLDRLNLGVILLGTTGRLIHVNAAADAILKADDGLTRTLDGLRAGSKEDDRRLQHLICVSGRLQCQLAATCAFGALREGKPMP